MMFTEACPLNAHLYNIVDILKKRHFIAMWEPDQFRALYWQVHRGVRQFLRARNGYKPSQTSILTALTHDLDLERTCSIDACPVQLKAEGAKRPPTSSGGDKPASDTKKPAKESKQEQAHPMAASFKPLIEQAKAASPNPQRFTLGAVLKTPADYEYVLGEIGNLALNNKKACGRFLMHKCTNRCTFSHALSSSPSREAINAAKARFAEKVEAYKAENA